VHHQHSSAKSYLLFNKPYGVLSQFTSENGHRSLADFGPFPEDVYPVGRLDADSEGSLLLTNDNDLKHRLTEPKFGHRRTYLVQVEGFPDEKALERFRKGLVIQGKMTKPAEVRIIETEPNLPPRSTPIRFRKEIPTTWLEVVLREGRNRQVRKMTAAIGYPTLRLVRVGIESIHLGDLQPGKTRTLSQTEIRALLEVTGL
jgi:23S rRNA pseudouridine2457 synthase